MTAAGKQSGVVNKSRIAGGRSERDNNTISKRAKNAENKTKTHARRKQKTCEVNSKRKEPTKVFWFSIEGEERKKARNQHAEEWESS